jgi:hypothetical protein
MNNLKSFIGLKIIATLESIDCNDYALLLSDGKVLSFECGDINNSLCCESADFQPGYFIYESIKDYEENRKCTNKPFDFEN